MIFLQQIITSLFVTIIGGDGGNSARTWRRIIGFANDHVPSEFLVRNFEFLEPRPMGIVHLIKISHLKMSFSCHERSRNNQIFSIVRQGKAPLNYSSGLFFFPYLFIEFVLKTPHSRVVFVLAFSKFLFQSQFVVGKFCIFDENLTV